jgi:hypothetical protein
MKTELKQIVVGENEDEVIAYLNLALVDVYSQFNVLEEEQIITMIKDKTRYPLPDNNMRVTAAFRKFEDKSDKTESLPLNDINHEDSVFTPTPYILHVPNPVEGDIISLIIAVSPPFITKANIDTVDFMVPAQFLEPILSYISYIAYKSMNADANTENAARYNIYLRSSNDVRKRGLLNNSIMTNTKTIQRGFA